LNQVEIGKVGEHICCVRLLKLGFAAEIVHMKTTDVVVDLRNKVLRIQVKACDIRYRAERNMRPYYQFSVAFTGKKKPLDKSHCDIMAFVSVPKEKVYFMPIESLNGRKTRKIKMTTYDDPDLESKTWIQCLKHLGEIK